MLKLSREGRAATLKGCSAALRRLSVRAAGSGGD